MTSLSYSGCVHTDARRYCRRPHCGDSICRVYSAQSVRPHHSHERHSGSTLLSPFSRGGRSSRCYVQLVRQSQLVREPGPAAVEVLPLPLVALRVRVHAVAVHPVLLPLALSIGRSQAAAASAVEQDCCMKNRRRAGSVGAHDTCLLAAMRDSAECKAKRKRRRGHRQAASACCRLCCSGVHATAVLYPTFPQPGRPRPPACERARPWRSYLVRASVRPGVLAAAVVLVVLPLAVVCRAARILERAGAVHVVVVPLARVPVIALGVLA